MESGQAQTLWHISHCITLSFHCLLAVYKHTQNLGSVNTNWSSILVPLILVDDVENGVMDFCQKQSVSVIDLASA